MNHAVMTPEFMAKEIARLTAENARLSQPKAELGMKVSEKGALSVYGLGRFPVTLYRGQWEKLFTKIDAIKAFIVAHESQLKEKEPTQVKTA